MPPVTMPAGEALAFRARMMRRTRRETIFPPFPWHTLWRLHVACTWHRGLTLALHVSVLEVEWRMALPAVTGAHWRGLAHRLWLRAYLARRAMRKHC